MNLLSTVSTKFNRSSDLFGASASTLCLIHCLATPLLFLAQAHGATDHHQHVEGAVPLFWEVLDYVFLVISALAVFYSTRNTTHKWTPLLMWSSFGGLAALILNEKLHLFHIDHVFVFLPAVSLVVLHLYNRRHCHNQSCANEG